jgi:drug/metabolite transporter (DMT)-like permease
MQPSMRLHAAGAALLAVLLFSGLDALVKATTYGTPLALVVFLRYAAGLIFSTSSAAVQGQLRLSWATIRRAVGRSLAGLSCAVLFFGALKLLPLAQTVALTFTSPFFMVLISAAMLGDPVTRRSLFAAAFGFLGVVVMLAEKLSSEAGSPLGFAMALASAIAYALSMIMSRRDTAHDSLPQMILVQNLISAMVVLPFALYWYQPIPGHTLMMFLAIGALGTGGNYAITWAYKHAPATLLGPFEFTALIWAVTFGMVFFAEVPSAHTLLGAVIIIGACLVVVQPITAPVRPRAEDTCP